MLCGLNTRSTANNILRVSMSLKLAVTVLFWVINRMEFGRLAVVVEAAGIICSHRRRPSRTDGMHHPLVTDPNHDHYLSQGATLL